MAKKKKQQPQTPSYEKKEQLSLKDQLGGDVLAKLQQAKQGLVEKEEQQAKALAEQKKQERKQREKNMSFEELLNTYGNQGSKY
ncbi:MAG: YqkE family protein [Caryophanon sp.]|nr:YqkE family protein [Caryophanon sp.]